MKYFTIVIVRLDRTIQNLMKTLDPVLRLDRGIKSGNDEYKNFKCLLAGLINTKVFGSNALGGIND